MVEIKSSLLNANKISSTYKNRIIKLLSSRLTYAQWSSSVIVKSLDTIEWWNFKYHYHEDYFMPFIDFCNL